MWLYLFSGILPKKIRFRLVSNFLCERVYFCLFILGSPNVLGQLTKSHSDVQSKLGPTVAINGTANDATKSKLSTSVPPTDHNKQGAQPITSISGKTQVREANKDERPVVVLMGYELGEKSSKKVHEVLRNSDPNQFSDQEKIKAVGLHRELANYRSAVNRTSAVRNGQANVRTTAERIATESFVPDSELEEIAELLDNAASASRRLHENKHHMHEGKGKLNTNANTLQLKMHATDLSREATSALQSKVMHDRGRKNSNPSLPISSDDVVNQQAFQRMTTLGSHLENKDSDLHVKSDTSASMVNGTVTSNHSESMERDLPMIVPGNKHQNINDPRLQVSACTDFNRVFSESEGSVISSVSSILFIGAAVSIEIGEYDLYSRRGTSPSTTPPWVAFVGGSSFFGANSCILFVIAKMHKGRPLQKGQNPGIKLTILLP